MTDVMATADDAAAAADVAAAALRALAYATRDSLTYPGDVYAVLGSLVDVAARLPQSCAQVTRFLELERDRGRVIAEEGQPFAGEPVAAVTTAAHWLQQAGQFAERLRDALGNAQAATVGLAHVDNHEGGAMIKGLSRPRTPLSSTPPRPRCAVFEAARPGAGHAGTGARPVLASTTTPPAC